MLASDHKQALHKSVLLRVLINILDNKFLSQNLVFKGGTCASMLGYLDRFSVDLDFDLINQGLRLVARKNLESTFDRLNLAIKDQSHNTVQYYLKYEAPPRSRNTLKIDIVDTPLEGDQREKVLLPDVNRIALCQTKETMFAHKLVALQDRFHKNQTIAARDLYDIHHYLEKGYEFNSAVIQERMQQKAKDYLLSLIEFIKKNVTQTIIDQDLNFLLDHKRFKIIRHSLKAETIALLKNKLISLDK